jgi:hypothetical protein
MGNMGHVCFISVRKSQKDEIGMFIAYKNREWRIKTY